MKDFEDALLDVSINNLTIASNKHSNIDNKAIAIITISGFLISLLAGGSISNSCGVFDSSYIMAKVLFLCCILAFFSLLSGSARRLSNLEKKPRDVNP